MSQPSLQATPGATAMDPLCRLALLDAEGRIEWVNDQLASLLSKDAESLTGLAPEALPTEQQAWFSGNQHRCRHAIRRDRTPCTGSSGMPPVTNRCWSCGT